MPHLRLLIIAAVTILILTLAAFALVGQTASQPDAGDVIVVKGGSITIECSSNCLESKGGGKFGHKENGKAGDYRKIVKIVVKDDDGVELGTFTKKANFKQGKPSIEITYRTPKPEDQ